MVDGAIGEAVVSRVEEALKLELVLIHLLQTAERVVLGHPHKHVIHRHVYLLQMEFAQLLIIIVAPEQVLQMQVVQVGGLGHVRVQMEALAHNVQNRKVRYLLRTKKIKKSPQF